MQQQIPTALDSDSSNGHPSKGIANVVPRLGNVKALARVVHGMPSSSVNSVQHKRVMIAEFCRMIGHSYSAPRPDPMAGLAPRHAQTLGRLLAGDSEKQIARHLGVSHHTVHVYVKALYRHFDVSSRGELLARFVRLPGTTVPAASPE